ncbi:efflux RND transporter periplasmic adaptor subunit [Herbaspirillum sp. LeCh32-8]|uniref:efflux RND transporter periplasmic adaptor subunit n=1 Tax=Herbaspirillum sp. LeCh32-8 TaxID=2821356 RepID=UPI001AE2EBAA|nr:efflux RND transporter periplasmic adaptor subunit [Herbaspirillum sp. LeCh32-8]MBP0598351.1 efflux RND transporter periplasmic adaptor subunit [Herbaspirillum sp. LeCh32-8]
MTLSFLKRRWLRWTLLALVLLMAAMVLLKKRSAPDAAKTAPASVAPSAMEFLPGDLYTVKSGELRQVLPLSGALRALNQASVKARVAGEVQQVLVREGEAVKEGQVLARIDGADYQAKVDQARGSLVASQGQLNIATQTRNNNQVLLDKGFISRNAFDTAASQFDIAKANVDSARGALDVARKALADTVVRSPIAGLISARNVQPGEKVAVDGKLLDVVDLSQMELEAPVPTNDILKVQTGQEVQVAVEGLPQKVLGRVVRINPATQSGSRSIMVYVRLDNPQGLLRAGMFADASLTLEKKAQALAVPATAIQVENGNAYVYAIENGALARRPVVTGLQGRTDDGNATEITSGLTDGAQIVRANLGIMRDGTPVRVLQQGAGNGAPASPVPPAMTDSARQLPGAQAAQTGIVPPAPPANPSTQPQGR